jgi:hypothetical protein
VSGPYDVGDNAIETVILFPSWIQLQVILPETAEPIQHNDDFFELYKPFKTHLDVFSQKCCPEMERHEPPAADLRCWLGVCLQWFTQSSSDGSRVAL